MDVEGLTRREPRGLQPTATRGISVAVLPLSVAVGLLTAVAAGTGLLWRGVGVSAAATTIRGQTAELLGRGLYEYDTVFVAANNLSSDLVTLVFVLPLLALSLYWYRRGSVRGHLLLLGVLGYLLYYGATYALGGVAFNDLFLIYVAMFSAGLFAFVTAFAAVDTDALAVSRRTPRRFIAGFMVVSGMVTAAVWLVEPIAALRSGDAPALLDTYTTLFTHAVDLGVIVPATVVAGVLIWRRRALGYVVAASLLVLEALLLPLITIATVAQLRLGVSFTAAEIVGPIASFAVLAVLAVTVARAILRNVVEPARSGAPT